MAHESYKSRVTYNITNDDERDAVAETAFALSSPVRINILKLLSVTSLTLMQVSKLLNLSTSAALFHLKALEKAKLIRSVYVFGKKKDALLFSLIRGSIEIRLAEDYHLYGKDRRVVKSMPIGAYTWIKEDVNIAGSTETGFSSLSAESPYETDRFLISQLCIAPGGMVEYTFPARFEKGLKKLVFSLEICSEAPNYFNFHKSDITFYLNNTELHTYTSPGDFGGRKGTLNPEWYPDNLSQFGELKTIAIAEDGVWFDGEQVDNTVTLGKVLAPEKKSLTFRFGNKEGCAHKGGINIFGSKFGDHPQDILMTAFYSSSDKV